MDLPGNNDTWTNNQPNDTYRPYGRNPLVVSSSNLSVDCQTL